jgi:flagellar biosynthesis protein FlhF
MQVKKFEAKTMKEALELVKVHLGPEAIILSAKDTHRGFGLMGEKSVEVTAAVSEETLRKKKIAESKLREDLRQRFQQIPATKQKEFINKVFKEAREEKREAVMVGGTPVPQGRVSSESRAQVSGMRYIDIEDEVEQQRDSGHDRVRRAAAQARAGIEVFQEPKPRQPQRQPQQKQKQPGLAQRTAKTVAEMEAQIKSKVQGKVAQAVAKAYSAPQAPPAQASVQASQEVVHERSSAEIRALENQVRELKNIVEKFATVPQMPMSMHPGAEQGIPYELSGMYQRLTTQGIQPQLVTGLLKKAQKELDREQIKKPALVDAWAVRTILGMVEVAKEPLKGRYHVFMGCTGQGKTSTLVKLASHLILKEKKTIAIVSLDNQKVGAADQLRIYAQILNVPFAVVRSPEEWKVAQQKLAHINHILVDCPGFNLRTMEEVEWLKRMIPPAEYDRRIHYVQSILARDEETFDIASRYQMLGFHDVIFTRCDEAARQGLLLNFQERFRVPIHSFGLGSRIPEDYEFATKERVVDFLFKLSKVSKREGAE